jgi:hypothetical protein
MSGSTKVQSSGKDGNRIAQQRTTGQKLRETQPAQKDEQITGVGGCFLEEVLPMLKGGGWTGTKGHKAGTRASQPPIWKPERATLEQDPVNYLVQLEDTQVGGKVSFTRSARQLLQ